MKKNNDKIALPSESFESGFKGYTMDELRYQRALLLIKREFVREKAFNETKKIKKQIPILNGKSVLSNMNSSGLVGKLMKGFGMADYIILAFQALRIGKKIGGKFKKKK